MNDENKRISTMITLLITTLKTEDPNIGALAMAHLLASHTKDPRNIWLENLGKLWDHHHRENNESA